jgi:hypothetical protein
MAQGQDKFGNLGDPDRKFGNLGKARSATKALKRNLKQINVTAKALVAKKKTLPKAVNLLVARLSVAKTAQLQANALGTLLKGLQNKKKKNA